MVSKPKTKNILSKACWKKEVKQHAGHQALALLPSKHGMLSTGLQFLLGHSIQTQPSLRATNCPRSEGSFRMFLRSSRQASLSICNSSPHLSIGLLQVWMTSTSLWSRLCTHTSNSAAWVGYYYSQTLLKATITDSWLWLILQYLYTFHNDNGAPHLKQSIPLSSSQNLQLKKLLETYISPCSNYNHVATIH